MKMMFRVYALYHLNEEFETFYSNMPSKDFLAYFNAHKLEEEFKKIFKDDLSVLAMTSLDLVDAWDFSDDELLTVLG